MTTSNLNNLDARLPPAQADLVKQAHEACHFDHIPWKTYVAMADEYHKLRPGLLQRLVGATDYVAQELTALGHGGLVNMFQSVRSPSGLIPLRNDDVWFSPCFGDHPGGYGVDHFSRVSRADLARHGKALSRA